MVWKGVGDDQRLFWSASGGSSWDEQQVIPVGGSSTDPALASFGNRLYMAWKGVGDDQGTIPLCV